MKFKTNSFLFMMLCATALNSWAGYYNTIDIDGVSIHLDKDKAGYVNVHDDHLGVLLASGNKYLDVKELIDCKGQSIRIHSIHYFNNSISSIIDVNFEKKLVLALVVIDAHFRSYQATVSKFNGNKNLLSGKGFWSNSSSEPDQNSLFYPGGSIYLGKISVIGEYIAPNDLDCAVDSFPGVWDIARKMKIIFPRDKDDAVIDSKCRQLFSGEKTLDELGGELINMK